MELIPLSSNITEESEMTDHTYRVDFENNHIDDMCGELEAVKQAVYKILNTERYDYVIYDRSYGIELKDLIGRPAVYVSAVIKGRIEEALLCDSRIRSVDNFTVTTDKNSILAEFRVNTKYGEADIVKKFVV